MSEALVPPRKEDEEKRFLPYTASALPNYAAAIERETIEEGSIDTLRVWGIVRRNVRTIAICVVVAVAISLFATWWSVPVYEATASVRITEGENSLPELDALKALGGGLTEVNTELEVLRSRSLIERVVDELSLRFSAVSPRKHPRSSLVRDVSVSPGAPLGNYVASHSNSGWTITAPDGRQIRSVATGAPVDVAGVKLTILPGVDSLKSFTLRLASREEALRSSRAALTVMRPSRDANVLTVTWRGKDPVLVTAVPNSLVGAFISRRVATRKAGARSTVAFLNQQIDTLASELSSAEAQLRAYREATGVVSFDEQAKLSVSDLATREAERSAIASELASLEGTLRDIRSRSGDSARISEWRQLLAFPTLLRIPSLATLLANLSSLEKDRADLLVRRTEKDPDVMALTQEIASNESQVRVLVVTYMEGLRQQVAAADQSLSRSNQQLRQIPSQEVKLAELQRKTQILGDLFTLLQTKRKESEIAEAVEDPSAQIVDYAQQPDKPVSPILSRNVSLAIVLGIVLALVIAFARDALDTKLHTSDQLQDITGLPVLGIVPHFATIDAVTPAKMLLKRFSRTNGKTALVASDLQSTLHEAFRALRVNIAFSSSVRPPKMLLITSAFPADGKSTSVRNLAMAMSEQRLRVLVVDADMRRGALHKVLGALRAPGLSELLVGRADADTITQSVVFDKAGSIDFISTGTIPPNPAELLGGARFLEFLKTIEPRYDVILFDSPPVNSVSDSLLIAAHMDGVLLVARGGKTDRSGLRFALQQLLHVRARILGAVLNDYDIRLASYYGGYYNGEYGEEHSEVPVA